MKKKGYSQFQLGFAIGLSQSEISKIESGLVNVKAPLLEAIAKALDIDIGLLTGSSLDRPKPDSLGLITEIKGDSLDQALHQHLYSLAKIILSIVMIIVKKLKG